MKKKYNLRTKLNTIKERLSIEAKNLAQFYKIVTEDGERMFVKLGERDRHFVGDLCVENVFGDSKHINTRFIKEIVPLVALTRYISTYKDDDENEVTFVTFIAIETHFPLDINFEKGLEIIVNYEEDEQTGKFDYSKLTVVESYRV